MWRTLLNFVFFKPSTVTGLPQLGPDRSQSPLLGLPRFMFVLSDSDSDSDSDSEYFIDPRGEILFVPMLRAK